MALAPKKRIIVTLSQEIEAGFSVAKATASLMAALEDISDVRVEMIQVHDTYDVYESAPAPSMPGPYHGYSDKEDMIS